MNGGYKDDRFQSDDLFSSGYSKRLDGTLGSIMVASPFYYRLPHIIAFGIYSVVCVVKQESNHDNIAA